MRKNVYEYFNCDSNEQLFELLVNKDEQVNDLTQFYNIMSQSIKWNSFRFDESHSGMDFVNLEKNAPQKGTVTIATLTSKLEVSNWSNFSINLDQTEVYKSFFNENTAGLMVYANDEDIDYVLDFKEYFELCGIKVIDIFVIHPDYNNQLYSYREAQMDYYESFEVTFRNMNPYQINESSYLNNYDSIITKSNNFIVSTENLDIDVVNDIHLLNDLDIFNNYYIENNLLNKHIIFDEDELIKTFKVALQDLPQEHLYIVTYNQEKIINSVDRLSVGALTTTIVPMQQLFSRYLDGGVSGAVLIHNHPSGYTRPSNADIETTIHLMDMAEGLNKEFIEHLIVGYSGHTKISHHIEKLHEAKIEAYETSHTSQLSLGLIDRLDILENSTPKFIGRKFNTIEER